LEGDARDCLVMVGSPVKIVDKGVGRRVGLPISLSEGRFVNSDEGSGFSVGGSVGLGTGSGVPVGLSVALGEGNGEGLPVGRLVGVRLGSGVGNRLWSANSGASVEPMAGP